MVSPAVAPIVPSYAVRTPYITTDEYEQAPTGVSTSKLNPTGSWGDNTAVLRQTIGRASGWVNVICKQVLAATADVQVGMYRVRRDGTVWVPCDYSPIIAVTSVQWGWSPASLQAMTDLTGLWIQRKVVQIPIQNSNGLIWTLDPGPQDRAYLILGYVNGYTNTLLADVAAANDAAVTVASPLGIVAGLTLNLPDKAETEDVVVDASYVFGSTTVPLTAPLQFAHATGTAISALPDAVKEATTELTSALIKTEGSQAIVLGGFDQQPTKTALIESGGNVNVDIATKLLHPFIRVR
jgi:hypothetical protein